MYGWRVLEDIGLIQTDSVLRIAFWRGGNAVYYLIITTDSFRFSCEKCIWKGSFLDFLYPQMSFWVMWNMEPIWNGPVKQMIKEFCHTPVDVDKKMYFQDLM